MALDDPKLPRTTLRGENLYVQGEEEPYFRDPEHTIRLRVDSLSIHRGYEPRDLTEHTSTKVIVESLRGMAKIEGQDRFAVIGLETHRNTPIEFYLRSIPEAETKFHWHADIGFHTPHDWEFEQEEGFWIQGFCTSQYFDDLLAAVRRGHVENIRVSIQTTLWTRDESSMSEGPRTWHLASPSDRESTWPTIERGNISSLTWEERFSLQPAKGMEDAKGRGDGLTARKPHVVELPAQVYLMLTALVAIGALLLLVTVLRH
jgi:hypothetical protein